MALTTILRGVAYRTREGLATPLRGVRYTPDPPATSPGGTSSFHKAWKTGDGTLAVAITSSDGYGQAIACATHTIVVAQGESTTQQIQLQMIDPRYLLHPYGVGPYKDAMKAGAELKIDVNLSGQTRRFVGLFKHPRISRDDTNIPRYTWPGTDHADKLFRGKRTFQTLGWDYLAPAPTNKQALREACQAAGVKGDWSGIITQRLGGPWHRQQMTPGAVAQEALNVTLDEWRTEEDRVVGYDPERGGRVWEYDVDLDACVRTHDIEPRDDDPIKRVKVLRPVATGSVIPVNTDDGQQVQIECFEFGDHYSASLSPPVNGPTMHYIARDHRAVASYIKYYSRGELVGVRNVLNPLDYSDKLKSANLFDIDRIEWTWGAATPDVDNQLEGAPGIIQWRGKPSSRGEIGQGVSARGPLDKTTVWYVGDSGVPDDEAFELPPNPLLYDKAAMIMHGERFLRRVGRQQVEHPLLLPLNHMISLGDIIRLKRDQFLGGSGWINLLVVYYQHVISCYRQHRQTTVTGVEFLE